MEVYTQVKIAVTYSFIIIYFNDHRVIPTNDK